MLGHLVNVKKGVAELGVSVKLQGLSAQLRVPVVVTHRYVHWHSQIKVGVRVEVIVRKLNKFYNCSKKLLFHFALSRGCKRIGCST